jgi:hypothetical protein
MAEPAEGGHDLIGDVQDAVFPANFRETGMVALGRNDDAARPHDRLGEKCRHVSGPISSILAVFVAMIRNSARSRRRGGDSNWAMTPVNEIALHRSKPVWSKATPVSDWSDSCCRDNRRGG